MGFGVQGLAVLGVRVDSLGFGGWGWGCESSVEGLGCGIWSVTEADECVVHENLEVDQNRLLLTPTTRQERESSVLTTKWSESTLSSR